MSENTEAPDNVDGYGNELTDEQQKRGQKILHLRQRNVEMTQFLNSVGVAVDIQSARLEWMMNFLHEKGLISYDDMLDEAEGWQKSLRAQLQPIVQQVKSRAALAGAPMQTESGLIIPGQNGVPRNGA